MKEILNADQMMRTIKRMTHEIIEKHLDLKEVVLLGVSQKGVPLAQLLKENIYQFTEIDVPVFPLDIKPYRDDLETSIPKVDQGFQVKDKVVILVDDVLFTGRSARAALDAINFHGRPKLISLAIFIDRGHREIPIRADFVGKNIPTSKNEKVIVDFSKMGVYID
ncbi:MAG: bifunctional pyr operon transcriptional regulator/uracil phosphoribosyltransferase PyrR [Acholeplasmataceae bacterium]|nr:bifunctional pyr operon transcriptional regulator/uracil phosphoribosyltransferase PyrR [Acholeplasmataceae bacterium]